VGTANAVQRCGDSEQLKARLFREMGGLRGLARSSNTRHALGNFLLVVAQECAIVQRTAVEQRRCCFPHHLSRNGGPHQREAEFEVRAAVEIEASQASRDTSSRVIFLAEEMLRIRCMIEVER
jgi:hypothetical protein